MSTSGNADNRGPGPLIVNSPFFPSVASLQEEVEQLRKDKERLDWLDEQREPISYDNNVTLHSYAWAIEAMNSDIRSAIDAALKGDKQ